MNKLTVEEISDCIREWGGSQVYVRATPMAHQLLAAMRENEFLKSQLEAATEEEMRMVRENEELKKVIQDLEHD